MKKRHSFLLALIIPMLVGCGSTAQRAAITGAGGAGAGAIGYALSNGDPMATAGAAVGGAILTQILQGPDKDAQRKAYNAGYDRGNADALKRHYWLTQRAQRGNDDETGRTVYYTVPAQNQTGEEDVQKVPHTVSIPVVE